MKKAKAAALALLPIPPGEGRGGVPFVSTPQRLRPSAGAVLAGRPLPWILLAGELGVAMLLLLSDKLPPVLIRGLQLFLSF